MPENFSFEKNPVSQELLPLQEVPLESLLVPASSSQAPMEKYPQEASRVPLTHELELDVISIEHVPSADLHFIENAVRTTRQNSTDTQLGELAQYLQKHS